MATNVNESNKTENSNKRTMKTVLITGASGFLGHNLVKSFIERGDTKIIAVLGRPEDKANALPDNHRVDSDETLKNSVESYFDRKFFGSSVRSWMMQEEGMPDLTGEFLDYANDPERKDVAQWRQIASGQWFPAMEVFDGMPGQRWADEVAELSAIVESNTPYTEKKEFETYDEDHKPIPPMVLTPDLAQRALNASGLESAKNSKGTLMLRLRNVKK